MLLRIKHGRSACSVEGHHSNVKAHCATLLGTLAGCFRLCVGALGCLLINLLHKQHVVLPCASLLICCSCEFYELSLHVCLFFSVV